MSEKGLITREDFKESTGVDGLYRYADFLEGNIEVILTDSLAIPSIESYLLTEKGVNLTVYQVNLESEVYHSVYEHNGKVVAERVSNLLIPDSVGLSVDLLTQFTTIILLDKESEFYSEIKDIVLNLHSGEELDEDDFNLLFPITEDSMGVKEKGGEVSLVVAAFIQFFNTHLSKLDIFEDVVPMVYSRWTVEIKYANSNFLEFKDVFPDVFGEIEDSINSLEDDVLIENIVFSKQVKTGIGNEYTMKLDFIAFSSEKSQIRLESSVLGAVPSKVSFETDGNIQVYQTGEGASVSLQGLDDTQSMQLLFAEMELDSETVAEILEELDYFHQSIENL